VHVNTVIIHDLFRRCEEAEAAERQQCDAPGGTGTDGCRAARARSEAARACLVAAVRNMDD
jgi:hypothetical protein